MLTLQHITCLFLFQAIWYTLERVFPQPGTGELGSWALWCCWWSLFSCDLLSWCLQGWPSDKSSKLGQRCYTALSRQQMEATLKLWILDSEPRLWEDAHCDWILQEDIDHWTGLMEWALVTVVRAATNTMIAYRMLQTFHWIVAASLLISCSSD